jgi:sulfopyruvate decarboxylase TPP-binding subunit
MSDVSGAIQNSGISLAVGVPDTSLSSVLSGLARHGVPLIQTLREDVAVGFAAGQALSKKRCVVYMKDAGLGHSLDAILSLIFPSRLPLLLIVGVVSTFMAQEHHIPWTRSTVNLLAVYGIETVVPSDETMPMLAEFIEGTWRLNVVRAIIVMG